MRFLRKEKIKKSIIVISDVHLGAGDYVNNKRNCLEDFHFDGELIDFLNYFSTGNFVNREVELIINGDFFDHLAVPFVPFYDDEYWSEDAAKEKMRLILEAHPEVMEALGKFAMTKGNTITFIIGNHDAELIFESLREMVYKSMPDKARESFRFYMENQGEYRPVPKVLVKHGHEYEMAHIFDLEKSIVKSSDGRKFFNPPWGSYYVTRVINKFKEERDHVNAVRPINKFLINGLIYDTFFIIRFILANCFYFIMVRTIFIMKQSKSFTESVNHFFKELELFQDYETLTYDTLQNSETTDVLIVGHTHEPIFRTYNNGKTFINTGTWTKMFSLDFGKGTDSEHLTFAKIDIMSETDDETIRPSLHTWKGTNKLPYQIFN